MKKTLVALAAFSVASGAFADVDVSGGIKMYGVIDQAAMSQRVTSANDGTSGSYSGLFAANATSRLGFKGNRDLMNGTKGIFQVEIQLDPDTSTLLPTKNRTAFVGLQDSNAGTIALGTMETAAYETFGMDVNGRVEYKPQVWRSTTSTSLQDRANNSIKYISPEFSGVTLHLQQSFHEQISTGAATGTTANTYAAISSIALKYHKDELKAAYVRDVTRNALLGAKFGGLTNDGPWSSNSTGLYYYGGYSSTTAESSSTVAVANSVKRDIASVSYDFGNFAVNYLYARSYMGGAYAGSLSTNTVGIKVPLDKFTVAVSYGSGSMNSYYSSAVASDTSTTAPAGRAKDGNIGDLTVGVYYNFDKSTSMYFLGSQSTSTVGKYDGSSQSLAFGARYNF